MTSSEANRSNNSKANSVKEDRGKTRSKKKESKRKKKNNTAAKDKECSTPTYKLKQ